MLNMNATAIERETFSFISVFRKVAVNFSNCKRNEGITTGLQIPKITEFIEYLGHWQEHTERRGSKPTAKKKKKTYDHDQKKKRRSFGKPLKRWKESVFNIRNRSQQVSYWK
jgi:hypothetical protein